MHFSGELMGRSRRTDRVEKCLLLTLRAELARDRRWGTRRYAAPLKKFFFQALYCQRVRERRNHGGLFFLA